MRLRFPTSVISHAVVFGLAFAGTLFVAMPLWSHDALGFRYDSSTARVRNDMGAYGTEVTGAISDYDANTDLAVSATTGTTDIAFNRGNYGSTHWDAGTQPMAFYSGTWQPCLSWPDLTVTGKCNKTDKKSTFAHIYLNTAKPNSSWMVKYLVRHEMGHSFGLSHADGSYPSGECGGDWSIMKGGSCRPNVPEALTAHDKADLNGWY